jgi:hypothetical protein
MRELFINNRPIDLGTAEISLSTDSNVFNDIGKITASVSNSIDLPHSLNNNAVFEYAEIPTLSSDIKRCYLPARYLIDGVQVISGYAVLLTITPDKYEVALTWGLINSWRKLVEGDLQLTALEDTSDENADYMLLSTNTTGTYGNGYFLTKYTSNWISTTDNLPDCLPCCYVSFILDKIASHYGITFDFPQSTDDLREKMMMPLVGWKRCSDISKFGRKLQFSITWDSTNSKYVYVFGGAVSTSLVNGIETSAGTGGQYRKVDANDLFKIMINTNGSTAQLANPAIRFYCQKACTISGAITARSSSAFSVQFYHGTSNAMTEDIAAVYSPISKVYVMTHTFSYTLAEGDYFRVQPDPSTFPKGITFNDIVLDVDTDAKLWAGCAYPIMPNLPEMTCIDFIKEICVRLGVFPVLSSSATQLSFIKAETITQSTPKELDVTEIEKIEFKFSDLAQHNYLKYLTDDYEDDDFKGDIEVNDATLDVSTDRFTSKFCGCSNDYIPLYSQEKDSDGVITLKTNNLKPRIARVLYTQSPYVKFNDMSFAEIVKNNYAGFLEFVKNPTLITCKARCNQQDVYNLDFSKSYYIRQIGKRYAVVSVEGISDYIYRFKLLQIG